MQLVTAAEMRLLDRATIETGHATGDELMERAGQGVVATMERQYGALLGMRVLVLCVACLVVSLFWAVFEQQGNTLQLWADRNTNWNLGTNVWFGKSWQAVADYGFNFDDVHILTLAGVRRF